MLAFTTRTFLARVAFPFSIKNSLINTPPESMENERIILKQNIWRTPDLTYKVYDSRSRNRKRPI